MPTDDDVALSAFWMNEATTADVAQDTILSKLSKSVLGNYESFIGGMRQVQEVKQLSNIYACILTNQTAD